MPDTLKQTALYDLHKELGAKLVPFAGYALPMQYRGIRDEHHHTRTLASLFDISHMGQIRLAGKNAPLALERLVPSRIDNLKQGQQRYTTLLNSEGGIVDDLIVTRDDNDLILVVNADCGEKDRHYLESGLGPDIEVQAVTDHSLIALQGPKAGAILKHMNSDCDSLSFMRSKTVELLGSTCRVSRCGYTGEDGFEISVPSDHAESLFRELLTHQEVQPGGLGARDTLRLEAGLCLYGHELNENITPVEAGLKWIISHDRLEQDSGFAGMGVIRDQLQNGVESRLVGLIVEDKAPVREGSELFNQHSKHIGRVTSGTFSPTLEQPVAMAYVDTKFSTVGTALFATVRKRSLPVRVTKLPFVPHRYYYNQKT